MYPALASRAPRALVAELVLRLVMPNVPTGGWLSMRSGMSSGDPDLERVRDGNNPGGVTSTPRVRGMITSWYLTGIGPAAEETLGELPSSNRAWSIASRSALTLMRTPLPVTSAPGIPGGSGAGARVTSSRLWGGTGGRDGGGGSLETIALGMSSRWWRGSRGVGLGSTRARRLDRWAWSATNAS